MSTASPVPRPVSSHLPRLAGLHKVVSTVLVRTRNSLETRGIWGTLLWAAHHAAGLVWNRHDQSALQDPDGQEFDLQRRVDTAGSIDLLKLKIASPNVPHGVRYQGSSAAECRNALARLPIRREDFTFVDLGCGKGRCLLIASEFPFRKVLGVEFSPELCEVARKNLRIMRDSNPAVPAADVLCLDATEFEFPPEPLVLYFYNPFDQPVMRKVIENLRRSLQLLPRQIYVIYLNPMHARLWEQDGLFRALHADEACRIYATDWYHLKKDPACVPAEAEERLRVGKSN